MMDYGTFINRVQTLAGLKYTWEAVIAVRSTLNTLQRMVFKGEGGDLATAMPQDIRELIDCACTEVPEKTDLTEFLFRISESAEIKISDAMKQAKSVVFVLQQLMTEEEIRRMHIQLSKEYNVLLAKKPRLENRVEREDDTPELPNVALTRKLIYQPSL